MQARKRNAETGSKFLAGAWEIGTKLFIAEKFHAISR